MIRFALLVVLLASGLAEAARPKVLEKVAFEQRLDAVVPADVRLRDESGREVRLGDLLGGKPVVLDFAYFRCPMLCPLALSGLAGSLKALTWSAGEEFQVITVSIDPEDSPQGAAEAKAKHLAHYARESGERGWRFLVGDETNVRALADAVGFRYARDEVTGQFAHAAGVVVLTPEGRVSRYLYVFEPTPRDLRLALVEAADGKIGGITDQILLLCFHWDPTTGTYGGIAMGSVRVAGALTVVGLGGFLLTMFRRERNGNGSGSGSRKDASADPGERKGR